MRLPRFARNDTPPLCRCEAPSSFCRCEPRFNRGEAISTCPPFVIARSRIPRLRFGTGSAISVGFPSCRCEASSTFVIARHNSAEAISGTIGVVSRQYYVYVITNNRNTVLYVGVTNDLIRRVYEHREKLADGFTRKYNITKLVYYEVFEDIENAILREKQIKAGSRQKKVQLINSINREWHDLYDEL